MRARPSFTFVTPVIDTETLRQHLDALLAGAESWKVIKDNPRNLIAWNPSEQLYYKSFRDGSTTERWKRRFRGNRAQRTLEGTRLLENAGCLAPAVLACGMLDDQDFVMMRDLSGPQLLNTLHTFLQDVDRRPWRKQLFEELGRTIGRLHAAGIVHGDLRPNNVIVHPSGDSYQLGLIDNERTRRPFLFRREQLRNLKQILLLGDAYITATEREAFFDNYFTVLGCTERRRQRLKRITEDAVKKHLEHRGAVSGTAIDAAHWDTLKPLTPQRDNQGASA